MRRILVTGAGGPAGVNFIRSLRVAEASRAEGYWIVGTDVSRWHLEWPSVNAAYESPRSDDPGYIDWLNGIIEQEGVELVHAQPDCEVRVLSENRSRLKAPVFLPAHETVEVLQDKLASAQVWCRAGLASREPVPINETIDLIDAEAALGMPFWLRATRGGGGTGSTLVTNLEMADAWLDYWTLRGVDWQWVAQEYLPGADLAFTSLWDHGSLVARQVRERREYIYPHLSASGITGTPAHAVTVDRPDVCHTAIRAIKEIDQHATGIFCVDLKEDAHGEPRPTEINCGRFFTTSNFFTVAGFNFPDAYVRLGLGEPVDFKPFQDAVDPGLHWLRHMDCPPVLCREQDLRSVPLPAAVM